ncbi:MAG: hypothetical protein GC161_16905 [Planctomycetaceae bacterium]|nr:hypothetical protein [Planctomycetaceae bacterium]
MAQRSDGSTALPVHPRRARPRGVVSAVFHAVPRAALRPALRGALVSAGLWAFAPGAVLAQTVWQVGKPGMPGMDFYDMQSAVDVAADGDVIVLRTGGGPDLPGFEVRGKSLTLIGQPAPIDPAGQVILFPGIQGRVEISDIGPDQFVSIRGMRVVTVDSLGPVLTFRNCRGPVLLESIEVEGYSFGDASEPEQPQLLLDNCSAVHVVGARVGPGGNQGVGQPSFRGAEFRDSNVFWTGGWIHGGQAVEGFYVGEFVVEAEDGADGLRVSGGTALLSGVDVRGGKGGTGFIDPTGLCYPSGSGGTALRAANQATLRLESTTPQGGAGALAPAAACEAGSEGASILLLDATLSQNADGPRATRVTSPGPFGAPYTVRLAGEPFDHFLVLVSSKLDGYSLAPLVGAVALEAPLVLGLASIGADGHGSLVGGAALVPPAGAEGLVLYLQSLVWSGEGQGPRLSAPGSLVLLGR